MFQSSNDGSEIKQTQLLCYNGTHKETRRLAIKSKGVIQVLRMFCLDRRLPKDWLSREGGVIFIWGLWQETARGGCDITIWWHLVVAMGFWWEIGYHLVRIPVVHWVLTQAGAKEQRGDKDHWMDGWSSSGRSFVGKSGRPWHIDKLFIDLFSQVRVDRVWLYVPSRIQEEVFKWPKLNQHRSLLCHHSGCDQLLSGNVAAPYRMILSPRQQS